MTIPRVSGGSGRHFFQKKKKKMGKKILSKRMENEVQKGRF